MLNLEPLQQLALGRVQPLGHQMGGWQEMPAPEGTVAAECWCIHCGRELRLEVRASGGKIDGRATRERCPWLGIG